MGGLLLGHPFLDPRQVVGRIPYDRGREAVEEIEEYEDKWFVEEAQKRLEETDDSDNIPFDEACKLAGWGSD